MNDYKIISHRGANFYAPQNTLPAFRRSVELGVDGFETDVHITKDGVPVICHNYDINDTSDGMGKISTHDLKELKSYDFGSYFSPKYKNTRIPTLEEFLTLCETADIEIMNIELKSPKEKETGIVGKTIAAVKEHGLFDKLLISSFDYRLLVEAKHVDPKCKTGFLYSPNVPITHLMWFRPVSFAKSIGADALHPIYLYVTKEYVKRAHKEGIMVNPWTCDDVDIIKRMLFDGVDGIITNYPDRVKSIINSKKQ